MSKFWADISTQWREGGVGSAWSNRRVNATTCLLLSAAFSAGGLWVIAKIGLSWPAIVCFVPTAAFLVASVFFSYFSSIQDLRDTLKEALAAVKAIKELTGIPQ